MMSGEPEVVVKDVWGICFYCHLRKGWRIPVQQSPIWPHPLRCPQCGAQWMSVGEFNADARATVKQVLRDNPGKIPEMNSTQEDREWQTVHNDAIEERKDRQNRQHIERYGKPWEPYYNDECKPIRITAPGVPYKEGTDGQGHQETDDNDLGMAAGAEAGRNTDTEPAARDRLDGPGGDIEDGTDGGDGVR